MLLITPKQSAEADRISVNEMGFDIMSLIDSAAEKLVDHLYKFKSVTIVSGPGNNGADGICAAIKLAEIGVKVDLFLYMLGGEKKLSENCKALINKAKISCEEKKINSISIFGEESDEYIQNVIAKQIESLADENECVLDCVLGTGFKIGKPRDTDRDLESVLSAINKGKHIISCDIPSGVDGETGEAITCAIKASETITFSYAKPGHFILPGKRHTGKLTIEEISVPKEAYAKARKTISDDISVNLAKTDNDKADAKRLLLKRDEYAHKGNFGKIMIIGGSEGMTGAPYLSAKSALLSGAGLCYMLAPRGIIHAFDTLIPEAVKLPVGAKEDVFVKPDHIDDVKNVIKTMDAVVFGPGAGREKETGEALSKLVEIIDEARKETKSDYPKLIIDADGLYFLANSDVKIPEDFGGFIMTPHEAEMGRLMFAKPSEIALKRKFFALACAQKYDGVVILKGNDTIIASPDGRIAINGTGNAGMATAGSGDVLSGIVGAFACLKGNFEAAEAGTFIHGLAGDKAKEKYTEFSVISTKILELIPEAFKIILIFLENEL